jgi:hypothetical protein
MVTPEEEPTLRSVWRTHRRTRAAGSEKAGTAGGTSLLLSIVGDRIAAQNPVTLVWSLAPIQNPQNAAPAMRELKATHWYAPEYDRNWRIG